MGPGARKLKNAWMQYILIALAAITAARCVKHLIYLQRWELLGFAVLKIVALAVPVAYLLRLSRTAHAQGRFETCNRAAFSMQFLLMISFLSDVAMTLLR